jgi:type III restriction enzyme
VQLVAHIEQSGDVRSATAIEQIVGRILRLPGAQPKQHPDLNCAYAFSVSPSIVDVLAELREALEHNGFTTAEAERIIILVTQGTLPLGAHPKSIQVEPSEIDRAVAEIQVRELGGKARRWLAFAPIASASPRTISPIR